jgi:uncharacterized repeat protein (TIGR03803 family)
MKKLLLILLPFTLVSMLFAQAPMEFFGVTNYGGPDNIGGIFRTDENANITLIQSFEKYGERTAVNSTPIEPIPGFIYAMTSLGGEYDQGVIYEYEIATGGMVIKHSFDAALSGKNPNGSLLKVSNGKLYGLTKSGGNFDKGVLFEYDLATQIVQKLYDFTGTDGEAPLGSLIQSSDGKLYGMTSLGGTDAKGVIFRYDILTGTYEKLKDFNATDGSSPRGDLLEAANGMMYGFTLNGGASNYGTMFSFDKTTLTYTKIQDLVFANRNPTGSFIEAASGLLYGVASTRLFQYNTSTGVLNLLSGNGSGTPTEDQYGNIFFASRTSGGVLSKYSPFSGVSTAATFTGSTALPNFSAGTYPCNGMLLASDGLLYGVTSQGSSGNAGALYTYGGSANSLRGLEIFDIRARIGKSSAELVEVDKKLYGFGGGGKYNQGTIYRYDMLTDSVEVMVDMILFPGSVISTTNDLDLNFVKHPNGKLYCFIYCGGTANTGHLIEYVPGASTYTTIYNNGPTGGNIFNTKIRITVGQDGLLYGVTSNTGANNYGVLFSFDVVTNTFTVLHDFTDYAEFPNNLEPIHAQNGKLYGITAGDVNGDPGVIYSYDPATSTYTEHFSLGAFGVSRCLGPFVEGLDGTLYASFYYGSNGRIIAFDPVTNTASLAFDFDNSTTTGVNPGKLSIGTNGKLYGLVASTYLNFFEFDPATSTYLFKHNFTAAENVSYSNFYGLAKICKLIPDTSVLEIAEICEASTYTKTSSVTGPTITYQWLKDGVDIPGATAGTLSVTAAIGDDGYYYCRIDNGCRWIFGDSVQLTVLPLPIVDAGADQLICHDSTAVLTASGDAVSYTWNNGVIDNTPFIVTASDEYVLTGVSIDGCIKTDTVNISITPEVNAGQDTSVCIGSPVTLTASGDALTYSWSDNVTDSVSFTVDQTHAYVLTGVNAAGCINTDTIVLTVLPLPIVIAGTDQQVCNDSLTVFSASGDAATYTWNNGVIDGDPFTITGNGEFIVTGTSADGCINTDTLQVVVSPVVYAGQDTSVCMSSLATLTASGDAVSYSWSGTVTDGVPFLAQNTDTYVVTGVNAQGCVNTDTLLLTILPLPIVIAGTDQQVCHDSLTVFNASGDAVSYSWNNGVTDGDPFVITTNGQYIVTGTSADGCINTDTLQVFISPAVYAGQDTSVCVASSAILTASGDALSYSWSGGIADGVPFSVANTDTYIVTGINAEGCTNTDTLLLTVDSCLIVWPGDTDNDFQVGTLDFFNVGIHFGGSGDPRNTITNAWLPQTANFWDSTMTAGSGAGLNMVYADCNGDGVINLDDTLAVQQNFASIHAMKPIQHKPAKKNEYGSIFFTSDSPIYGANQFVTIDIHAGTSDHILEQVYGLGFDLNYSASGIVPGSFHVQMNDLSWVGEVTVDAIRLGADDGNGAAHLGLCRIDHSNVSSYGVIGHITFLTSTVNGSIDLDVSTAFQTDSAGLLLDLESEPYSVVIDPLLEVGSQTNQLDCSIYPNPSTGLFNVAGLRKESTYAIALRDLTGKLLFESSITNQTHTQIKAADLSIGSYLLEISDGHSVRREQIVVISH